MATRPLPVPTNAVEIPPNGAGTPPGWDPQLAGVEQFEATIAYLNRSAGYVYAGAYRDWKANADRDRDLGIVPPPPPNPPHVRKANVVWADNAGDVHTVRETGDAAWIWET